MKTYKVKKCSTPITIDADWNKPAWQGFEALNITLPHWPIQSVHLPDTKMKMQYDDEYLYLIFQVHDQYIKAAVTETNGPVCQDSCVEFFFVPDNQLSEAYFSFEVNCCGVMFAAHQTGPRTGRRLLEKQDVEGVRIAASAAGPIHHEIVKPLTWTVEYSIPFKIISNYAELDNPVSGTIWRANFYKCADKTSHPHWLAWSPIKSENPDFHRPESFGCLEFE